ncbi:MAG TPA: LacI family DNA-binding transcriptional regulator [Ktedonobacteraceae bacterium]|nr:LacI family DNA-binding transcriptional regulator [Ktedonobacteraceae bacterium]
MVTSEQVARQAGVSQATVSRVINGSRYISTEVRERVLAAINELGYEPDMVARNLVQRRSRIIAINFLAAEDVPMFVKFGHSSKYFYIDVLGHIEREAMSSGYDLLMPFRPRDKSAEGYVRGLQTRRVAGCIMLIPSLQDPRLHALLRAEIPTVFVGNKIEGNSATYVATDHVDSARQITEHLLSLGHRRIAFLAGSAASLSGRERLMGCRQALAQAGIALDDDLILQPGWEMDESYKATSELLDERRDFTAIVAASDVMAIGALRALNEHGLRVPEDISLASFDGIDFSEYTIPPLTTMWQDRESIGRGAVQRLITMIEETGQESPRPLIVPTRLVIRKSTGPAPTSPDF